MTISPEQAVERLRREIQTQGWADLREVYNELFPQPITVEAARQNSEQLLGKIIDHIDRGLEIEEIESLWHLTFSKERIAYYDEEANVFQFKEDSESER